MAIGQTGRVSTPLIGLTCGDDPAAWEALGFGVAGGSCRLGPVAVRLDAQGGGLGGWTLGVAGDGAVDGIPTAWRGEAADEGPATHPNGVTGLDHVVIFTDSRDRTVAALVDAGGDLRRSGGPPRLPAPMAFVRMGGVIVEVAEDPSAQGAALWGVTAVVPDVDALAATYPARFGEPREAVQPGRRIVTARRRDGLETPLAFITPRGAQG